MKGRIARIDQTDIAKGIGIILVVIGHSFPDSNQLADGSLSQLLYQLIYSFHMPFFFFVSGLVSAGLVRSMSGKEKLLQIKKKSVRLLVPYFVFGAVFIPLRILFSDFARFSYDFSKLYTVFLGNNPCGQLWFLYVLFLFSLSAILFADPRTVKYLTALTLVLALISPVVKLRYDGIAWSNVLFMSFFYYLGLFLSQYHARLYEIMRPRVLVFSLPVFSLSFYVYHVYGQSHLAKIVTSLSGICILLCISEVIFSALPKLSGFLREIGSYSMDVYIFHSPMGILWRIIILRILKLSPAIYTVLYIITGVMLSYCISRFIVRRIPILSLFLLGTTGKAEKLHSANKE